MANVQALQLAFHAERRDVLRDALVAHDWNIRKASFAIDTPYTTVFHWLRIHPELREERNRKLRQS